MKSKKPLCDLNLPDFLNIPFSLLSYGGIRLFYWHDGDRISKREQFCLAVMICNVCIGLPALGAFALTGQLRTDLDFTAYTIFCLFGCNATAKMAAIVLGRQKLDFILRRMLKNFPLIKANAKNAKMSTYFESVHKGNMSLTIFHFATTSMFNVFPIIQSSIEYWQANDNENFIYRFPLMMAFPFDTNQPLRYFLIYFFECNAAYFASLVFLGSDLILVTTIYLINLHFEHLIWKILNFKHSGTKRDAEEFVKLLDFHNELLVYTVKLDEMFNVSIFMNYFATGLLTCMLGYQCVAGSDFLNLIKFLAFLFASFGHMYMIAKAGNDLTDMSLSVSDALFHHDWYLAPLAYQKLLPLTLARAQRPAYIKAFKFFTISMESFKTFLTTSYQIFALLNTQLQE